MKKVILFLVSCMVFGIMVSCSGKSDALTKEQLDSIELAKEDSIQSVKELRAKQDSIKKAKKLKNDSIITSLQSKFRSKKDDFYELTRITHKTFPYSLQSTGIQIYFQRDNKDSSVSNLRFRIQYYGEDWLFIRFVVFNIDGKEVTYIPDVVKRDNYTSVWEWCDESADHVVGLINKISKAKSIKMMFVGSEGRIVRTMSQQSIKAFKETLDYYIALGGTWSDEIPLLVEQHYRM